MKHLRPPKPHHTHYLGDAGYTPQFDPGLYFREEALKHMDLLNPFEEDDPIPSVRPQND